MQVKVLSVKNPFAYSIIYGGKDVENRTWNTDYRGRLYIHVSGDPLPFITKEENPPKFIKINDNNKILQKYERYATKLQDWHFNLLDAYVTAGIPEGDRKEEAMLERVCEHRDKWLLQPQRIIGYVDIVDVVKDSQSPWSIDGQYHWILKNPSPLKEPICSVKGRLGLWNYNLPE